MQPRSILISRAFWTLFVLEALVCAAGVIWVTYDTRGWGPEGARHSAVPEEMEKILAKYGAETSRP
jgi:hypothetical protein